MLAPPVHLLPVRVPVGLGLVVKTPGEAGVVPPVVVVFLRPVPISIAFLPIRFVLRVIPTPPVIGAGVPGPRTIVVPIPVTWISIIVLAGIIICIVVTLTAPSTFGIIVTFRIPLPGSWPVRAVTRPGAGPLELGVAVAVCEGSGCTIVGPVSGLIEAVDVLLVIVGGGARIRRVR